MEDTQLAPPSLRGALATKQSMTQQARLDRFVARAPRDDDRVASLHPAYELTRKRAAPRGLAWLGRQGARAIAALVLIGIALPPLGEMLKPYVAEAIFLLPCISLCAWISPRCATICGGPASCRRPRRGP
jgi:hypothetical protein